MSTTASSLSHVVSSLDDPPGPQSSNHTPVVVNTTTTTTIPSIASRRVADLPPKISSSALNRTKSQSQSPSPMGSPSRTPVNNSSPRINASHSHSHSRSHSHSHARSPRSPAHSRDPSANNVPNVANLAHRDFDQLEFARSPNDPVWSARTPTGTEWSARTPPSRGPATPVTPDYDQPRTIISVRRPRKDSRYVPTVGVITRNVARRPSDAGSSISQPANASPGARRHSQGSAYSPPLDKQQKRATIRSKTGVWELGKTIGAGSMGKVKLARHAETHEQVAIKIVPRQSTEEHKTDEDRQRADRSKEVRTAREAAIVTLVNHPYICGMRDVVRTQQHWYMLFEYVNGGQMLDYIISHGRLKEKQARKFARQIASALDYAHSNNIVHRDLKIENILISKTGDIKIIDFGLSNTFTPGSRLKTFCGSLYFAAPELLQAKAYTGPEVDIWSFGIVLYVLVCGKVPFDDQSMPQLHAKIKKGHVEYPTWLGAECRSLISRMLVVDPTQRATMLDIVNHPWMIKGFTGPPDNHIPYRAPLKLPLDRNVIRKMDGFDFGTASDLEKNLYKTVGSDEYQRVVKDVGQRSHSVQTPDSAAARRNTGVFEFYKRRSSNSRDGPGAPSSTETFALGPDPTSAFSPLISIYYLAKEKLEREMSVKEVTDRETAEKEARDRENRLIRDKAILEEKEVSLKKEQEQRYRYARLAEEARHKAAKDFARDEKERLERERKEVEREQKELERKLKQAERDERDKMERDIKALEREQKRQDREVKERLDRELKDYERELKDFEREQKAALERERKERLERERREKAPGPLRIPWLFGDKSADNTAITSPATAATNSATFEMEGELTGGRNRPRARTHGGEELSVDDTPTRLHSAAAGLLRKMSVRNHRDADRDKTPISAEPSENTPSVEITSPQDKPDGDGIDAAPQTLSTSGRIRKSFSLRHRGSARNPSTSASAIAPDQSPSLLEPPSVTEAPRNLSANLNRSQSVNSADVSRNSSRFRRGTSEDSTRPPTEHALGNHAGRGASVITHDTGFSGMSASDDPRSAPAEASRSSLSMGRRQSTRGGRLQKRRRQSSNKVPEGEQDHGTSQNEQQRLVARVETQEEHTSGPRPKTSRETLEPPLEESDGADDGSGGELNATSTVKPVYLKGLFSVSTTSSKPFRVIESDIARVLDRLAVKHSSTGKCFRCTHVPSIDLGQLNGDSFSAKKSKTPSTPIRPSTSVNQRRRLSFGLISGSGSDKKDRPKTAMDTQSVKKGPIQPALDLDTSLATQSPDSIKTTPQRYLREPRSFENSEEETAESSDRVPPTSAVLNPTSRPAGETSTHVQTDMGHNLVLRFEIYIVKVPLFNLHGIQFKKVAGGTWQYKNMAQKILQELKL